MDIRKFCIKIMRLCGLLFTLLISGCSINEQKQGVREFDWAITYYSDSTVKEIVQKKDGLLEGKAFKFSEFGSKLWEFNYERDQQDGIQYYYVDGRLSFEVPYKRGKRNGWSKRYSGPCGDVSEEGQYINDEMNGLWYEYYDRELLEIDLFSGGSMVKAIYRNMKYPDRNVPLPLLTNDCNEKWRSGEE